MAADADAEIEATLTRLKTLVGGRVYEGAVPDGVTVQMPYMVASFTAPVRSGADRILSAPDLRQPHVLGLNLACIAADAKTARTVRKAAFNLLVDWAPSNSSDTYEATGSWRSNPRTENTPSRFVEGGFYETVVNNVF